MQFQMFNVFCKMALLFLKHQTLHRDAQGHLAHPTDGDGVIFGPRQVPGSYGKTYVPARHSKDIIGTQLDRDRTACCVPVQDYLASKKPRPLRTLQ